MKALAQALEGATGGQVVFRSGGTIVLHRGPHWQPDSQAPCMTGSTLQGAPDKNILQDQMLVLNLETEAAQQSATCTAAHLLGSDSELA